MVKDFFNHFMYHKKSIFNMDIKTLKQSKTLKSLGEV